MLISDNSEDGSQLHVLAGLAGCLAQTPAIATVHGVHISTQESQPSQM